MKVIYIRKRTFANLFLTIMLVIVSLIYTRTFREGTLKVFLNNDMDMPIYCVEIPDKRIAITFDTAWGDQYIQDITSALKRYNIKATFFITGAWADRYPDLLRSIAAGGHEVGNHSTTHTKMTGLTKNKSVLEIRETELKIKKITGKNTKLFRAPFGEYNNTLISAAKSISYTPIRWDIDSLDWKGVSQEDLESRVISKAGSGSIVLFHSNAKNTVSALPQIIEKLRNDEYRFVTVSELLLKENYYIDSAGRQRALR